MKKLFTLTCLALSLLTLSSCNESKSDSFRFIISYELKGENEVVKSAIYVDGNKEINDKTFRYDLSKLESVRLYQTVNGQTLSSLVKGEDIDSGYLLLIRTTKPVSLSGLKKVDVSTGMRAVTSNNLARSGGTITASGVSYGDEIAFGNFTLSNVPFFLSTEKTVVDPSTLEVGTKGYGGYYDYGSKEQYRYFLPFEVR